jgi:dihydrofolate reductase
MPWHIPEDFAHFRKTTNAHTLLMGRTTFDSIGKALPGRDTIVLTRNQEWTADGVLVAHDVQSAIDLAEDTMGSVMVVGGSHIYAATQSIAHMQILSRIPLSPVGDATYPPWDPDEWELASTEDHQQFRVESWVRKPRELIEQTFQLSNNDAALWWNQDWADRLQRAVQAQKKASGATHVDWPAVHQAAMQVLVEAAEATQVSGGLVSPNAARRVRLNRHLSLQDLNAVQGALLHWSEFLAPRR